MLSSADEKFFLDQWIDLCNSMARPLREKSLRPFLLQSLKLLVETYCSKFSKDETKLTANLDQICSLIFPTKVTKGFQGESISTLEFYVDIIISMAKYVQLTTFHQKKQKIYFFILFIIIGEILIIL